MVHSSRGTMSPAQPIEYSFAMRNWHVGAPEPVAKAQFVISAMAAEVRRADS
jgi:hypothetical protein